MRISTFQYAYFKTGGCKVPAQLLAMISFIVKIIGSTMLYSEGNLHSFEFVGSPPLFATT